MQRIFFKKMVGQLGCFGIAIDDHCEEMPVLRQPSAVTGTNSSRTVHNKIVFHYCDIF